MLAPYAKPYVRSSGVDALFACPGSRTLTARMKEVIDTEDVMTLIGNWCHAKAARRMVDEFGAVPPSCGLGPLLSIAPDVFAEWIVRFYVDTVTSLIGGDWAMEVECELAFEFAQFILTGHLDCYGISPDGFEAIICDLKTGTVSVDPAEQNWQLFAYLILLTRAYPMLKRARMVIIQPRNKIDSGYERVSEVTVEIVPELISFFVLKMNEALANPYQFETGYKQCRFCPPQLTCPAMRAEINHVKLILTEEQVEALDTTPNLEALGTICAAAKAISGPLKKAQALLKAQLGNQPLVLADGTMIRVEQRNGPREFTDTVEALTRIDQFLPKERALQCMEFSFPDLEAAVADELGLPKTSKKEESAESYIKKKLGDIIIRKPMHVLSIT